MTWDEKWEELGHHFRAETRQDPPPFGEGVIEWDYSRYTRALGLGRTPGLDTLKRRGCAVAAGRPEFRAEVAERVERWSEERGWRFIGLSAKPSTVVPDPVIYHLGIEVTHPDSLIFCAAGQQGRPALGKRPRSPAMRIPLTPAERWLIAADRVRRRVRAESATQGLVLFIEEAEQLTPSALSILSYFLDAQCGWKAHLLSAPAQIYIVFATNARDEPWFRETLERFSPKAEPFTQKEEIGPKPRASTPEQSRSVEQDHVLDVLRYTGHWLRRRELLDLVGSSQSDSIDRLIRKKLVLSSHQRGCDVVADCSTAHRQPLRLGPGVRLALDAFMEARDQRCPWVDVRSERRTASTLSGSAAQLTRVSALRDPRSFPLRSSRQLNCDLDSHEDVGDLGARMRAFVAAAVSRDMSSAHRLSARLVRTPGLCGAMLAGFLQSVLSLGRTLCVRALPRGVWSRLASSGGSSDLVDLVAVCSELFFDLRRMSISEIQSRYGAACGLWRAVVTGSQGQIAEAPYLMRCCEMMLNRAYRFLHERGTRSVQRPAGLHPATRASAVPELIPGFLRASTAYSEMMAPNAPVPKLANTAKWPAIRELFLTSGVAGDSRVVTTRVLDDMTRRVAPSCCRGFADEVALLLDFQLPAASKRHVVWSLSALFGLTGRNVFAATHLLGAPGVAATRLCDRTSDAQWIAPLLAQAGDLDGAGALLSRASRVRGVSPYANTTAIQAKLDLAYESLTPVCSTAAAEVCAPQVWESMAPHLAEFVRRYWSGLCEVSIGRFESAVLEFDRARASLGVATPGEARALRTAAVTRAGEARALMRFERDLRDRQHVRTSRDARSARALAASLRRIRSGRAVGALTRAVETLIVSRPEVLAGDVLSVLLILRREWAAEFGAPAGRFLAGISQVAPQLFERATNALRAGYITQLPESDQDLGQIELSLSLLDQSWDFENANTLISELEATLNKPIAKLEGCRYPNQRRPARKPRRWPEDGALIARAIEAARASSSSRARDGRASLSVMMAGTLGRTDVIWHRTRLQVEVDLHRSTLAVRQVSGSERITFLSQDSQSGRYGVNPRAMRRADRDARGMGAARSISSFLGESDAAVRVRESLDMAASCRLPVLLLGETGTGKGLAAEIICAVESGGASSHVALNCAAVPEELIELEMFGARKGSFTGAAENKIGLVARADGHSLILDEVDSMSPRMQAAMLRVFDNGEYRPIGGCRGMRSDFRLIACAGPSLQDRLRRGQFRQDLYYRISGLVVELPPLRDRIEDVEVIARSVARAQGVRLVGDWQLVLRDWHWPGNVRELVSCVEVAAAFARGPTVSAADLREALRHQQVKCVDRPERSEGNSSRTAETAWLNELPDAFSVTDAMEVSRLSRRTAQRRLASCVELGLVARVGAGRSTRYQRVR